MNFYTTIVKLTGLQSLVHFNFNVLAVPVLCTKFMHPTISALCVHLSIDFLMVWPMVIGWS